MNLRRSPYTDGSNPFRPSGWRAEPGRAEAGPDRPDFDTRRLLNGRRRGDAPGGLPQQASVPLGGAFVTTEKSGTCGAANGAFPNEPFALERPSWPNSTLAITESSPGVVPSSGRAIAAV